MGGILSQDEVDALLQAVEDGEVELSDQGIAVPGHGDCEVTEYSFRRPNLLTRDQLRLFTTLHDHFAGEAQSRLSLTLRATSEVKLVASDQLQYHEFVMSLPDVTHLLVLGLDAPAGSVILDVGLPFIYTIVDIILGGTGETMVEHRHLTDMEQAIAEPVLDELIRELTKCLAHIAPCHLARQRTEASPQYVQAVPAETPVMVMTFEARIGEGTGVINLCYPIPIVERLLIHAHGAPPESTFLENGSPVASGDDGQERIAVDRLPVNLRALLGTAALNVRELLELRPGDVLVLDAPITALTQVEAEGVPLFHGRPGKRHGHLVVKVNGYCQPDDSPAT